MNVRFFLQAPHPEDGPPAALVPVEHVEISGLPDNAKDVVIRRATMADHARWPTEYARFASPPKPAPVKTPKPSEPAKKAKPAPVALADDVTPPVPAPVFPPKAEPLISKVIKGLKK